MDGLMVVLEWLKKPENLAVLGVFGAVIAAVIKAIWEVYKYFDAKKTKALEQAQQSKSLATDKAASLSPPPPSDATARRTDYLRLMAREWRTLPLEVVDHSAADAASKRLTLEQVYISLDTTTPRPESHRQKPPPEEREGPLSAVEALQQAEQQRLVLLGQPGFGKSPFGRYLSLTLTEALLNPGTVNLAEQLPGWTSPAVLPVFTAAASIRNQPDDRNGQRVGRPGTGLHPPPPR